MTASDQLQNLREHRTRLLADPHRPTYHFVALEGLAMPFDPNGCLYWRGRYHLFYIFQDPDLPNGGHCWGHASSIDLVHWVHHPTALSFGPEDPEAGIFSGNGFINKEGIPTLVYFGVQSGICIATSEDERLDRWVKSPANPVIPVPKEGEPGFGEYNVFDPHCWLEGDTYYVALGGKVLPKKEYDTVFLFKSTDMVNWEYVRPFYEPDPEWTGPEEDCACPDFFRLGDRHMLLCISHPRGCRYYLGRYEDETFLPEEHHRMNWPGGTCFAPESLLDAQGRRVFWAWVLGRRPREVAQESGWSGVMTLPRVLSLHEDGSLRIEPAEELSKLRQDHLHHDGVSLASDTEIVLEDVQGDCLELAFQIRPGSAREFGVAVRRSPGSEEQTLVLCNPGEKLLEIDFSRSSLDDRIKHYEYCMLGGRENPEVSVQQAPFELGPGESLNLRIFIDRSIVEVFANDRQCVTQRIYPTRSDSVGVSCISRGGSAEVTALDAWTMAPANPW